MASKKNVIKINLETPITDWRRNNVFTIHRNDLGLLRSILPPNVQKVYVREDKQYLHVKLILFG